MLQIFTQLSMKFTTRFNAECHSPLKQAKPAQAHLAGLLHQVAKLQRAQWVQRMTDQAQSCSLHYP
jgi:hypothetical protein